MDDRSHPSCLLDRLRLLERAEEEAEQGGEVRDVIRLIEDDGWILSRTRGSHRQYKHPTKPGLVTIPGKPPRTCPSGFSGAFSGKLAFSKINVDQAEP